MMTISIMMAGRSAVCKTAELLLICMQPLMVALLHP